MRYYGKIHIKLPIFRVKSVKFTPAKKNLHGHVRGERDKYQVWVRQLSDLGLTKDTKNVAKCWHLQFLAVVSYLDT